MVINSTLTIQPDNVHIVISSDRSRPQSVPNLSCRSPKNSPDRSHNERKQRLHRQIYIPNKAPFINFASAYINPYRTLTPIIINHNRRHRLKKSKCSKRKQKKSEISHDLIPEQENLIDENSFLKQIIQNTNPIDLWPSDPNSFDMDFIRQRQIAIDNTSYRETIHTWKPSSIDQLTTLIKDLIKDKNIIDHVWIIFYWISQNILYDIDADVNHNQNLKQKSDDIFTSGKTTYEGYATIFKTLCDNIDVKCIIIPGYAKDSHFQINQSKFSQINHIWNAVQFNGNHWYLIDTVLGSGYIDNKHKYKKHLNIHYFLTHPEYMIYNHFPNDSQWQFLAKPISMFDFFRLPYLHSYYFIYNLTLISPRFSSIVLFDKHGAYAEVLVQAPNDVQLTCSIKNDHKSTYLTQYDISRQIWQCLFAPCKVGFHTLIIYANRLLISNSLINVIELGVEVTSKDFIRKKIFPITYGKFIEHKCQIFSPLDGILKCGTKVTIHCRIPNASFVRISLDGIWLEEMTLKNDTFKQQITVPQREIIIYAQFGNKKLSNIYYGLIRYLVEK
ncbi:unnamed protein product [Rotaria sp. Silwood2]|nr:unnamed protein product [Rotaria sp. Silwood2]CAF2541046.1 unnamed protein product [Rotaria sp. Silwood2]CAF2920819.1 unnamed protein product [Rotaria sp. Silwood2]CAF3999443.1 unnamed protein product [Rotaria sp. Silwood2]CAF4083950.1 unnamed protein product [Rotaria sp. Silwood2]